jgi:nucleotide-binding universal stress UspA family protein
MNGTLLISYDGSEDARAAVREAGKLFPGRTAEVLTVWQSARGLAGGARAALPGAVVQEAMAALDEAAFEDAATTAAEGAALAREHGLDAAGITARAESNVWSTVLREAGAREAAVIVVGSRGRSGMKASILGSVSAAVTANSPLPVLVARASAPRR